MIASTPALEHLLETLRRCAPEDRDALLDRLYANDPDTRLQIEDLLAEQFRSSSASDADTLDLSATLGPRAVRLAEPAFGSRFRAGQVIAGRFAVVRYLARGGMGEVYEVEDRLLQGVRVALKVMRPEIAADPDSLRRFQQEVVLARKVSHPNLCPIYDIAHCEDPAPPFVFLTMKLLSGETLSSRVRTHGPMSGEEASTIAGQMTAGLAALHDAGIIHRDIKPNNVMIDHSGKQPCVSIMDFGLARLHEPEAASLTGTLAGTPGYVAPELYSGQSPSQASDLFAFGVLLHELLTGERPRTLALASPVATSPALDHAGVPPVLVESVKAFLSPEPAVRCSAFERLRQGSSSNALSRSGAAIESAAATASARRRPVLIRALASAFGFLLLASCLLVVPAIGERVRGILFSSNEKHVAVLPLDITGTGPESQAIGDGLIDSLAGKLSNLSVSNQGLWVVPASDVRDRKVKDSTSAMREFGATIVVKGSFEQTGNLDRLQLSLIDPKNTRQIGFVDVENKSGDLAALQDEAVTRLARLMNLSVKQQPAPPPEASSTRAAYEDYLAGTGYYERQDQPGNIDRAIASLQSAVKTDPHFALAFARLAQVYIMKFRVTSDAQWLRQAELYSRQAAELDSTVPSTYVALAQIHALTGNQNLAVQEYQRALSLDPQDADALTGLAHVYQSQGKNAEAEAVYVQASSIRPADWTGYNNLGIFYETTGRPKQAIEQFNHALELTHSSPGSGRHGRDR